jgi:hypothetical protein
VSADDGRGSQKLHRAAKGVAPVLH